MRKLLIALSFLLMSSTAFAEDYTVDPRQHLPEF